MNVKKFSDLINSVQKILIIQADNPDGDSLASALALESLLIDKGKEVILYCGVEIPTYLTYMHGADRVTNDFPRSFDGSIIVDTSALSLLEIIQKEKRLSWLKTKPCIVIDHHATETTIDFASLIINQPAVSTGEIVYKIASELGWELDQVSAECIAYSILSDSLGLMSESVNSETLRIMSELVSTGVSLAKLDSNRRSMSKKTAELVKFKGQLLQRIEYAPDSRIATIDIPWKEIEKYSYAYNPSMLVIDEMRMTDGVMVAIAFKSYPDGKVTAKIRSNYGITIAGQLAEHFGGGGHTYAAGFKITDGRPLTLIKSECIRYTTTLLDSINKDQPNEVIQHTF